jgi:hypothetical protein
LEEEVRGGGVRRAGETVSYKLDGARELGARLAEVGVLASLPTAELGGGRGGGAWWVGGAAGSVCKRNKENKRRNKKIRLRWVPPGFARSACA